MFTTQQLLISWLVLALSFFTAQKLRKAYTGPLSKIPGPWYARLTNVRLKASVLGGRRVHYIHSLHQRYGAMVRIAPDEVTVADTAAYKEIHRIGGGFLKSPWYLDLSSGGPGAPLGIFNMLDAKQHAQRRKMFARGFSQNYLRDRWESVVREKVDLAIQRVKQESVQTGSVDVLKWFMYMASDISAALMFGESFQMLETGLKAPYMEAIEAAGLGTAFLSELRPLYWLGRMVPLSSFKKLFHCNEYLLAQGKQAVVNSRFASQSSNIFATIVSETEKDEESLSDLDVQIEAGNLILAGTDTTANTLTFLVWAVVSRPELRLAVEEEVSTVEEPLADARLEQLPVLGAVIEEALRLYCAAPGTLPRIVPKGGANLGDFYVPEGVTVGTQAFTNHRDPNLFPNPDEFDHTRWLRSYGMPDAAKAAFGPFGAGTRICIGLHLAKMELRLATARFFRECKGARLAPSTTPKSMEMENYFLITPKAHKCEIVV